MLIIAIKSVKRRIGKGTRRLVVWGNEAMTPKGSLNEGACYFEFILRAAFLASHVELVSSVMVIQIVGTPGGIWKTSELI